MSTEPDPAATLRRTLALRAEHGTAVHDFDDDAVAAVLDELERLRTRVAHLDSARDAAVREWKREHNAADELQRERDQARAELEQQRVERAVLNGYVAIWHDAEIRQHDVDEIRCQACRAYMAGPLRSTTTLADLAALASRHECLPRVDTTDAMHTAIGA